MIYDFENWRGGAIWSLQGRRCATILSRSHGAAKSKNVDHKS
jgi:hypothetical protein